MRRFQVGKCLGCQSVYRWDNGPKVREAKCPKDELPLRPAHPSRMGHVEKLRIQEMEGDWMRKSYAKTATNLHS